MFGDRLQEKETPAWEVVHYCFLVPRAPPRGGSRGVGLEGVALPLPALRIGEIPECAGVTGRVLVPHSTSFQSLLSCVTLAVVSLELFQLRGQSQAAQRWKGFFLVPHSRPRARASGGSCPRLSYPHLPEFAGSLPSLLKYFSWTWSFFSFEKGTLPKQRVGVRKRGEHSPRLLSVPAGVVLVSSLLSPEEPRGACFSAASGLPGLV